ncbi:MAG: hypothetical protein MRQ11_03595 [Candidatus Midichloria mitochondrii]|uniref:hypothetical protein n=1 Tax=Candidatus Midichloria mitochondrii TaxID=234827 RepID=UPI0003071903|nr:hypothetical protein [Candidatus Midichloria mitochondrii]MDJ1256457.1 hypothetical protein [Candidatus Midichloria mitochondrii]MDJ1288160.1 hypothetical protein [Candidatus Midichloria mitochondrii]MDJ1299044.1 hypothetical protein [Candidatus Midichloria mitochondrii]MDJ1313215.1 hypothetical protein [Candidatus Midichloria mitochondrii]MDJ1583762.1 hypothetical protein [Candidatus Midichloria mitochondrii]
MFYDFFTIEDADKISFKLKNALEIKQVDATNLLPVNSEAGLELLNIQRAQNWNILSKVNINYIDKFNHIV